MGAFEVSSRAGRVYLYDAESEGLNGTMSTRGRDSNFSSRSLGVGGIDVSGDLLEVGRSQMSRVRRFLLKVQVSTRPLEVGEGRNLC